MISASAPHSESHTLNTGIIPAVIGAFFLGIAWWYPDTIFSAVLTWPAAAMFCLAARGRRPILALYIGGLILQPLGFYWLFGTISHFGGFSIALSIFFFALFVIVSALQFAFFGFLTTRLPKSFDSLALRAPIAWITAELLSVRIFPWHLGHTEIAFTSLVQIADVFGSLGV
ncbi:MAG: hypothetical protein KDD60_03500, partial [Bdellovibrionales bacterium]|nr:hypothetical protein [Bdellovibrionales bacterium]